MASEFIRGVLDLDDIFKLRVRGARSNLNYKTLDGVDLASRYEATVDAKDQIGYDTGFVHGSTDFRQVFQDRSFYQIETTHRIGKENYPGSYNDGYIQSFFKTRYLRKTATGTFKVSFSLNSGQRLIVVEIPGTNTSYDWGSMTGLQTGNYTLTTTDMASGASHSITVYVGANRTTTSLGYIYYVNGGGGTNYTGTNQEAYYIRGN